MAKRIFILCGHPASTSLSRQFAELYGETAKSKGADVRLMHLHDMDFDPDFEFNRFDQAKPLEPDLQSVIDNLNWADHFVLCTPMWWGGLPARLKGLIDRAFLPGLVFDTRVKTGAMPKPMLSNISAHVIITADTPGFVMRLLFKNALLHQLRRQILGFIGIKPVRFLWLAQAGHAQKEQVERWLERVRELALQVRA